MNLTPARIMFAVALVLAVAVGVYLLNQDVRRENSVPATDTTSLDPRLDSGAALGGGAAALDNQGVTTMTYEHVVPGEYSEVYVVVSRLLTNQNVTADLSGPGVISNRDIQAQADKNGNVRLVWRVNRYGEYSVVVKPQGSDILTDSVVVQ